MTNTKRNINKEPKPFNSTLLIGLLKEYIETLEAENDYQDYQADFRANATDQQRDMFYIDENKPDRPAQEDFKRIGVLLRRKTIDFEKYISEEYWNTK